MVSIKLIMNLTILQAYTPGILLHPPLLYFNPPLISYFMFLTLQHVYFWGMGGVLEN